MRLGRVRLRRLWHVGEQFVLAATAQNLKRRVRFLAQRPPKLETQVSSRERSQGLGEKKEIEQLEDHNNPS